MSLDEFRTRANKWGKEKTPFLFIIDFELQKPLIFRVKDIDPKKIQFNFKGFSNVEDTSIQQKQVVVKKTPIVYIEYKKKFEKAAEHLAYGNTFLINLTIKTPITTNNTLYDLFVASSAQYKLLFSNQFLVFSPEAFIKIDKGKIFSYPMKGTIDASVPHANQIIINDEKEKAEHVTIVDLIRNDLSMVATDVKVSRFRYIDQITTHESTLLQVSSEITGNLPDDYPEHIGDILISLLPAGSITGAPKERTVQIIRDVEAEPRGYYTGVMGYFDGKKMDSAVMIRFIEKESEQLYYRSGGGITTQSTCAKEYEEVLTKIYVPII